MPPEYNRLTAAIAATAKAMPPRWTRIELCPSGLAIASGVALDVMLRALNAVGSHPQYCGNGLVATWDVDLMAVVVTRTH